MKTAARALLLPLLVLALAAAASARPRTIELPSDTQVKGVVLEHGPWRVTLSPKGDTVTLTRAGGTVVRAFACETRALDGRYATDLVFERKTADGRSELTRLLLADELVEVTFLDPIVAPQSPRSVPMANAKEPLRL